MTDKLRSSSLVSMQAARGRTPDDPTMEMAEFTAHIDDDVKEHDVSANENATNASLVDPFARALSLPRGLGQRQVPAKAEKLIDSLAAATPGARTASASNTPQAQQAGVSVALAASPLTSLTVLMLEDERLNRGLRTTGAVPMSADHKDELADIDPQRISKEEDKSKDHTADPPSGNRPWLVNVYSAVGGYTHSRWQWSVQRSQRAGLTAAYLWQIAGLLAAAVFVVHGEATDGLCEVRDGSAAGGFAVQHASSWAKGSWFTGLLLACGRRVLWGANADGAKALVDAVDSYASALSVLATLQLADLLWASQHDGVEEICVYVQRSELLTLGWAAVCLLGWYSAWDTVLKRTEGLEQDITVLSMLNPVGVAHELLVTLLAKRPQVDYGNSWVNNTMAKRDGAAAAFAFARKEGTLSWLNTIRYHWRRLSMVEHKARAKQVAAALVVCAAVVLSLWSGWGGLAGLRSAVVLAALAGVSNAIAVDRLLWLIWCIIMLVGYSKTIKTALTADGFSDASDTAEILAVVFFVSGRSYDAEHCLPPSAQWLAYTEPVGFLVAELQSLTGTKFAATQQAPLLDALERGDYTAASDTVALRPRLDKDVVTLLVDRFEPAMHSFLKTCHALGALPATAAQALLVAAAKNGHMPTVQWLAQDVDVSALDKAGGLALRGAAYGGNLEIVQWLVEEAKVAVGATDEYGVTPLHRAAYWGHIRVVRWLVEEGKANVSAKNKDGWTPLHTAAEGGRLEVVRWLVEETNVDVRATGSNGKSPLQVAEMHGKAEVVRWLSQRL